MRDIFASIIRASAFLRKELAETLRQPRLLLTLVLGPFLILLIFGIGYRNQARVLRTLFVVPADRPELKQQVEQYATTLGDQLSFAGIVSDQNEALSQLRARKVDLIAVPPADAYDTIKSNQQAVFTLYHHEIDPFQVDYVNYFGQVYIDEVNRRVLLQAAQQGQSEASNVQQDVKAARGNASAVRQALQAGDQATAQQQKGELSQHVDTASLALGASLGLLSGVKQSFAGGSNPNSPSDIMSLLNDVQQGTNDLNNPDNSGDTNQELQRATKLENDLAKLDEQLTEFTSIDPNVLVRPFRSEAKNIAPVQPTPLDFFTPAVIALLLQHLMVTFAALSIVGERTVGTMELFRVSPLSAIETLFGKYLSYLIFGALLTLALTLLIVFGLKVPMLGAWWSYALVVAGILFTSLGYGFVISLISQNDSQAVQYSMIMLLTSVFFSGFILALEFIWKPVQVISWLLPTTYGIILLRDIMLRGDPPSLLLIAGLFAIGIVLASLAWLLLRRLITAGGK